MNANHIKFGHLQRVLSRYGFRMSNAMGSHRVFSRKVDDTILLFPPLRSSDDVDPANLAAAAKVLDERGIATKREFNDAISQLAGKKPSQLRRAG